MVKVLERVKWNQLWLSLTVIAVVILVIISSVRPAQVRNRDASRKADLALISGGLASFIEDYKVYPNPTYNLGSFTDRDNAKQANFGLGLEIADCVSGDKVSPNTLINQSQDPDFDLGAVTAEKLDQAALKLRPGYLALNNFFTCLGYTEGLVQDPLFVGINRYQYRVSYDYKNFLLAARLESETDSEGRYSLFADGAIYPTSWYFTGNGLEVRQLDDDSDLSGEFYEISGVPGSRLDGNYFYQCYLDGKGAVISEDRRSTIAPLIKSIDEGKWGSNSGTTETSCQSQAVSSQVVVTSY